MNIEEAIIHDLFETFWLSGMVKVKKKNARVSFAKLIKKQSDPIKFTKMLVEDVKKRLEIGQFGFSSLHPTSYLNGERWEDEYRGQVNEESNRGQQSFSDNVSGQAERARSQLSAGGICANNIRPIRGIRGSISE